MSGINVDAIVKSLGDYSRKAAQDIRSATLGQIPTTQYFKTVYNVDDEYFAHHSITDRVVAGFKTTWQELGTTKFKTNLIKARHFKVNYPVVPATVWKTYLSYLANEKLDMTQYPITRYLIEKEIAPAVNRDRDYLLCKGVYDGATYDTVFGASVDGLDTILRAGILDGSMYKIQLPAFTISNMAANVEKFVRAISTEVRGMIDYIFTSQADLDAYRADYRAQYGLHTDFNKDGTTKEYFSGIPIVGLPNLSSGRMFATYADNRVRVVNNTDMPIMTDVQKADYKVKLFFEWFEGVGFHINQHVFVSVEAGAGYGSGLSTDNTQYFVNQ